MRKITTLMMAILFATTLLSQEEDNSYFMYENTYLAVKSDKVEAFAKAMAKHNETFHKDGPFHANVWSVVVGTRSGQFVWSMGPCTFTDLDSRPDDKAHNDDWVNNVMPNVWKAHSSNMYRNDKKRSYWPEGTKASKLIITTYDIKNFETYRFKKLLDQVTEVYKEKEYKRAFSTYWPAFSIDDDADIILVGSFDKWAEFDENTKFKKDFEEVHGEGSWDDFMSEYKAITISQQEEVWSIVPELSGGE